MSDTVAASPSQLQNTGSSIHSQSGTMSDLITNLNSSTGGLINAISVSPLTGFSGELETLYGRIGISMNCFTDALHDLGNSLHVAAQSFSTTDAHIASTFHILDQALQPYVGFEAPKMVLPTIIQTRQTAKPQPPSWFEQAGSWISTHASDTWHWVSTHPLETAGVGLLAVGSIALAFFTGGASIPVEAALLA